MSELEKHMEVELRKKVIEVALSMVKHGLVVAKEGNVSAHVPHEEKFAITPSQVPYEKLTPRDIPILDFQRNVVEGRLKPSIESAMHLAIYRARKDVGAVVHSHSPYATAVSTRHETIQPFLDEQVPYLGGEIKTARYGMAGTEILGVNAVEALEDRDAVLIANHGVVCCGRNLDQAFRNALIAERAAMIFVIANMIGGATLIPASSIEAQRKRYEAAKQAALKVEGRALFR
jgi:L-fuculose-phosphate aldolase